ncbi:MAG: transposase [Crocinitomix sp.]|jgi:transposase
MVEWKEVIGIDISKNTFDARVHTNQFAEEFENSKEGFKKLLKWAYKSSTF